MPVERRFVLNILTRAQDLACNEGDTHAAELLENIKRSLASGNDIRKSVRDLHRVSGLDEFSIRLLWLIEHVAFEGQSLSERVIYAEAASLYKYIAGKVTQPNGSGEGAA